MMNVLLDGVRKKDVESAQLKKWKNNIKQLISEFQI